MSFIRTFLEKILLAPTEKEEGDLASYKKAVNSDRFVDKVVYGVSNTKKGFLVLDPVKNPGALYCGGMGSGKSIGMRFTVGTHIATNSENTFYILVDTLKGMTDYTLLFEDVKDDDGNVIEKCRYRKNVVAAINDSSKIVPVIEMVHAEAVARKHEFSRVGASNIYAYDKIMKEKDPNHKGLARMMICIEEFHAIPNSNEVKFSMNVDRVGSVANKFKELMRIGRSYGIFFMFATQRATSEDVPSQLKPGLSMMMAFRMNNPGEASAMNLPHAQEIGLEQRGRCAYGEMGEFIQYPYIDDGPLKQILEKKYKPLTAKLLKYDVEDYHKALSGKGNSGMIEVKPLLDIVKFANQYQLKDIAKRFLREFSFENIVEQENEAYGAELIAEKYGVRYAIKLINNRNQGSKDEVDMLKEGVSLLDCEKLIVIASNEVSSVPSALSSLAREDSEKYIIINPDLLENMAKIIDNKEELESKNKYSTLYLKNPIADPRDLKDKLSSEEVERIELEKKKIIESEQKTDINYDYIVERGFIDDPLFMKKILINQHKYNIYGLSNEEEEKLLKKFNIDKSEVVRSSFDKKNEDELQGSKTEKAEEKTSDELDDDEFANFADELFKDVEYTDDSEDEKESPDNKDSESFELKVEEKKTVKLPNKVEEQPEIQKKQPFELELKKDDSEQLTRKKNTDFELKKDETLIELASKDESEIKSPMQARLVSDAKEKIKKIDKLNSGIEPINKADIRAIREKIKKKLQSTPVED